MTTSTSFDEIGRIDLLLILNYPSVFSQNDEYFIKFLDQVCFSESELAEHLSSLALFDGDLEEIHIKKYYNKKSSIISIFLLLASSATLHQIGRKAWGW